MAKQIIRHLEFYGFLDQNTYNSTANVDLTEIQETNKEQTEEINNLNAEKADLVLVEELSGKVDSFIESQTEINSSVSETLSGISKNIEDINVTELELIGAISGISEELDSINENIEQQTERIDGFEETVDNALSSITESLNEKVDKTEIDDEYVKKDSVYTKNEVYSKQECDDNFLTHQDISNLVTHDELDTYATDEDLASLSGNIVSYVNAADVEIENGMEGLQEMINDVDANVQTLSQRVDSDYDNISLSINTINGKINYMSANTSSSIANLNETKADKNDLHNLENTVSVIENRLDSEISAREYSDTVQNTNIENLQQTAQTLAQDITNVSNALNESVANLIGASSDTTAEDTIYGAKNYAKYIASLSVSESKNYTDEKYQGTQTLIENEFDTINTVLTGKANIIYVDALVNERDAQLETDIENAVTSEKNRAMAVENVLSGQVSDLYNRIPVDIRPIENRINVITTYTGTSALDYDNSGTGVLDVLHREFHALKDEIDSNVNPTIEKNNDNETAVGQYNVSNSGNEPSLQTIFSVGIGTSDSDRKNAFEVRKNGDIYMWINNQYVKINDVLGTLLH